MSDKAPAAAPGKPFDVLLDFLKRNRGFDFTGYKRSTLERRIAKRMSEVGFDSHVDYVDYLEVHPEEFSVLFNTILINVTGFFRDEETWKYVADTVLPGMLEKRDQGPFRVWCAGCASGEETFTTAILLAEAMGEDRFREAVKIYATDVDEEALEQARSGAYPAKDLEPVPQALLERYFERNDQRYHFRKDLRRNIIFGRNDLVQDAPISRVDLLICRNTLMYFNAEVQGQILARLHFALQPDGVLVLGKSEMLLSHTDLFTPMDLRRRVFTKVPRATLRDRMRVIAHLGDRLDVPVSGALREEAYDHSPGAQVVLDAEGKIAAANADARTLFNLNHRDIGQPVQDFELSYRPVELRGHLDRLAESHRPIRLETVEWTGRRGEDRVFEVVLTPLVGTDHEYLGATVAFIDVTEPHRLQEEVQRSKRELEQAYEELQSTVEELETTNEELQSTNEELETTNEELQSSNEELETMNEELQSTNEELETMNDELRQRSLELNDVNDFLEVILSSMGTAVVVLDGEGIVQAWNSHARDLWGLGADEVEGRHFLSLDIGLPVDELRKPLLGALKKPEGQSEVVLDATTRRGRAIRCQVTMMPLGDVGGDGAGSEGIILLMAEQDGAKRDGR